MLDATESWLREGGRLMYMGGNGYYWRVAYHSTLPGVMEVRRAEGGIRTWAAQPGEYHMSFSGELGGLWQRQRRAPNMIAGVGFVSQGFDQGSYYRRTAAADDHGRRLFSTLSTMTSLAISVCVLAVRRVWKSTASTPI